MEKIRILPLVRYQGQNLENPMTRNIPVKSITNVKIPKLILFGQKRYFWDWDWDWPRISCSISEKDDMFQNCFNFIINFVKAVLSECILIGFSISRSSLHWKISFVCVFSIENRYLGPHMISCAGPPVRMSGRRRRPICFIKLIFYTYWFHFQVYLFQWDKIEYRLLMNTSKTLKRLFKNPHI